MSLRRTCSSPLFLAALLALAPAAAVRAQAPNPAPPASPVKLVFIHHSTGENWLNDENGGLGIALRDANYFVSDTNYGWGPNDLDLTGGTIGDHTDIGNYYSWFVGPHRDTYLAPLYAESSDHCGGSYGRLGADPGGPNRIVMFKSCFPNSNLGGSPSDPIPPIASNPLRNQDCGSSEAHTVANAKGIYQSLLTYFATKTDTLFVLVVSPPLIPAETDATTAANARALSSWLLTEWLASYPYRNVFVFDFYNVLTSDGGSTRTNDPDTNDLGWADGNHHRYRNGAVERTKTVPNDMGAYSSGDSHPSRAGNLKATGEFVQLLNVAYNCWQGNGGCPYGGTAACSVSCSATVPPTATAGSAASFAGSATATGCTGAVEYEWDFGDLSEHARTANATHTYTAPGTYGWRFEAKAGGESCTRTGQITVGSAGSTCTSDGQTLCLNQSRFRVRATYRDYANNTGNAQAVPLTNDTGYFWFFGRDNVEVVLKVLDFCGNNGRWAVYAAGLTDVEISLSVTDTRTGSAKTYTNALGIPFVLIRDAPFACP